MYTQTSGDHVALYAGEKGCDKNWAHGLGLVNDLSHE